MILLEDYIWMFIKLFNGIDFLLNRGKQVPKGAN